MDCIAGARSLEVRVKKIDIQRRSKNTVYVAKAGVWRHSPYVNTLLIDADTMFVNDPTSLFPMIESGEMLFTRFSDWTTNHRLIRGRLERWRRVKAPRLGVADMVQESLASVYPAINTGVVGFHAGSSWLPAWRSLTEAGWRTPFTDELAAQLLLADTTQRPHLLADDRYNCSPIYGVNRDKAVIWHFHGNKHLRGPGRKLWAPAWREVWQRNIAHVRRWAPATDKNLANEIGRPTS